MTHAAYNLVLHMCTNVCTARGMSRFRPGLGRGWDDETTLTQCSYVDYHVWRYVKNVSNWTHIATVSHGTTTYTDPMYARTATYTDDLLSYRVHAHYTLEGTTSDATSHSLYGEIYFKEGAAAA